MSNGKNALSLVEAGFKIQRERYYPLSSYNRATSVASIPNIISDRVNVNSSFILLTADLQALDNIKETFSAIAQLKAQ